MKLICELSGEHTELPFAELELLGTVISQNPQVAIVEAQSPEPARRLSLSHYILSYIGECHADLSSFTSLLKELALAPGSTFSARVKKIAGSSIQVPVPKLENIMGSEIRGVVSLGHPDVEFRAIFSADRCYIGRVLFRIDRGGFDQRRPGSRAFFHPGVMMPRIARALVNISLVREGDILLDPFCGTGGIVLEAEMIGIHGIGVDINRNMVQGSRKNVPVGDFIHADGTALPFCDSCIDAVVSDFPYGQSVSIGAESLDHLYENALYEIRRILLPGRRAVVVTHRNITRLAGTLFMIEGSYSQRVHRSLTRNILVLRK
jgi:tRNA (guanine10-N2)-dimethyltransferase